MLFSVKKFQNWSAIQIFFWVVLSTKRVKLMIFLITDYLIAFMVVEVAFVERHFYLLSSGPVVCDQHRSDIRVRKVLHFSSILTFCRPFSTANPS